MVTSWHIGIYGRWCATKDVNGADCELFVQMVDLRVWVKTGHPKAAVARAERSSDVSLLQNRLSATGTRRTPQRPIEARQAAAFDW